MSVVTRWRRTFSSSVTHLTVISGFLAVNSFVSPCMRIMSLLFTVAMVSVVWAIEGAEPNRVTAQQGAEDVFHGNLPISDVEHMPTPCNYVHTDLQYCQGLDRKLRTALARRARRAANGSVTLDFAWPVRSGGLRPAGFATVSGWRRRSLRR